MGFYEYKEIEELKVRLEQIEHLLKYNLEAKKIDLPVEHQEQEESTKKKRGI